MFPSTIRSWDAVDDLERHFWSRHHESNATTGNVEELLSLWEKMLETGMHILQTLRECADMEDAEEVKMLREELGLDAGEDLLSVAEGFLIRLLIISRRPAIPSSHFLHGNDPSLNTFEPPIPHSEKWDRFAECIFHSLDRSGKEYVEVRRRSLCSTAFEHLAFIYREREDWEKARAFLSHSLELSDSPRPQVYLNMMSLLAMKPTPSHDKEMLRYAKSAVEILEHELETIMEEMVDLFVHASAKVRLSYHTKRVRTARMLCVAHLHACSSMDRATRAQSADVVFVSESLVRDIHSLTMAYADLLSLAQRELGDDNDLTFEISARIDAWSEWLGTEAPPLSLDMSSEDTKLSKTLLWKLQVKRARHFITLDLHVTKTQEWTGSSLAPSLAISGYSVPHPTWMSAFLRIKDIDSKDMSVFLSVLHAQMESIELHLNRTPLPKSPRHSTGVPPPSSTTGAQKGQSSTAEGFHRVFTRRDHTSLGSPNRPSRRLPPMAPLVTGQPQRSGSARSRSLFSRSQTSTTRASSTTSHLNSPEPHRKAPLPTPVSSRAQKDKESRRWSPNATSEVSVVTPDAKETERGESQVQSRTPRNPSRTRGRQDPIVSSRRPHTPHNKRKAHGTACSPTKPHSGPGADNGSGSASRVLDRVSVRTRRPLSPSSTRLKSSAAGTKTPFKFGPASKTSYS